MVRRRPCGEGDRKHRAAVSLAARLAIRYCNGHAVRHSDICKKSRGAGSGRRWLSSAILKAALLGTDDFDFHPVLLLWFVFDQRLF